MFLSSQGVPQMSPRKVSGLLLLGTVIAVLLLLQSYRAPIALIDEVRLLLGNPVEPRGLAKAGLWLVAYLSSLLAVVLLVKAARRRWAILLLVYVSLAYAVDMLVQMIGNSHSGISSEAVALAINEVGRASNMTVFSTLLVYSALIFVGLLVLFLIFRKAELPLRVSPRAALAGLLGSIVLVVAAERAVYSIYHFSFPAPVKLPILVAEYIEESLTAPERVLSGEVVPRQPAAYNNIVWLIDESVGGNYLSINGYERKTTPFLESRLATPDVANFGVAAAISNCSSSSNYLLRIGFSPSMFREYDEMAAVMPTIFQYAKRAGFETALIDNQVAPGELQNFLSRKDMRHIDQYITSPRDVPAYERDVRALGKIRELLADESKKHFIVLVKGGAHWPYNAEYPPEVAPFQPASQSSAMRLIEENREPVLNSYLNAIYYGVDHFFSRLFDMGIENDAIFLYTSDHGQSLFHGKGDELTHCHTSHDLSKIPLDEFRVPLMVVGKGAKQSFSRKEKADYEQIMIFPTTLQLMGYDEEVYRKHGPTLFEGDDDGRYRAYIAGSGRLIEWPAPAHGEAMAGVEQNRMPLH